MSARETLADIMRRREAGRRQQAMDDWILAVKEDQFRAFTRADALLYFAARDPSDPVAPEDVWRHNYHLRQLQAPPSDTGDIDHYKLLKRVGYIHRELGRPTP